MKRFRLTPGCRSLRRSDISKAQAGEAHPGKNVVVTADHAEGAKYQSLGSRSAPWETGIGSCFRPRKAGITAVRSIDLCLASDFVPSHPPPRHNPSRRNWQRMTLDANECGRMTQGDIGFVSRIGAVAPERGYRKMQKEKRTQLVFAKMAVVAPRAGLFWVGPKVAGCGSGLDGWPSAFANWWSQKGNCGEAIGAGLRVPLRFVGR